jgi:hypothetical protein
MVIACDDFRRMAAAGVPPIVALTKPPWRYLELETGHWPMLSRPVELAKMLDGIARGRWRSWRNCGELGNEAQAARHASRRGALRPGDAAGDVQRLGDSVIER